MITFKHNTLRKKNYPEIESEVNKIINIRVFQRNIMSIKRVNLLSREWKKDNKRHLWEFFFLFPFIEHFFAFLKKKSLCDITLFEIVSKSQEKPDTYKTFLITFIETI